MNEHKTGMYWECRGRDGCEVKTQGNIIVFDGSGSRIAAFALWCDAEMFMEAYEARKKEPAHEPGL